MNLTPLTDLVTVKGLLDPAGTAGSASDGVLGNIINAVSATIQTYCGRNFLTAAYTETYSGSGTQAQFLRQRPIQSVTSVTLDAQPIPAASVPGAWGYAFDGDCLYFNGALWNAGHQNLVVTYTAGLPAVSLAETPDLWMAAAEWVVNVYKNLSHLEKKSDSSGQGQSTAYLADMPWTTRIVIDRYRHVAADSQALGL